MRGFFFLLLLTNVALVAWQYFEERGRSETVDVYAGIPIVNNGLPLIGELPEERRPRLREAEQSEQAAKVVAKESARSDSTTGKDHVVDEGELPATTLVAAAEPRCFRIDDIADKASLNGLLTFLRKGGATGIEQHHRQIKRSNFWVMLPAYANRKKASEAAEILSAKRVRDFFIVRSGEHENAISLGVFSTRERAERRYRQIVELKARLRKPRIESIDIAVQAYQVSYQMEDIQQTERVSVYLKREQLSQAEQISCK
jgi:hypothetical protein